MSFDPVKCGIRIRELRKRKDLTQAKLAEELNVYSKYISKIERGSTASIDLFVQIAEFFEVSTDYLLLGEIRNTHKVKTQLQTAINLLQEINKTI